MYTKPNTENMLNLEVLSTLSLNVFNDFEKHLFTDEERALPNFDRFGKFYKQKINFYESFFVYVPYEYPKTMVEYQINHYVLWGVLAHTQLNYKPYKFFSYNEENEIYFSKFNECYACDYSRDKAIAGDSFCSNCPIYRPASYACEKVTEPYSKWRNTFEPELKSKYAEECMHLIWYGFNKKHEQSSGYFGVQDCTPDQLQELKMALWEEPDADEIFEGLECAEDIPDDVIFSHYQDTNFTSDDFFCSADL